METTKYNQTMHTVSEPLPPLPCGDGLITYKNLKHEKNCAGDESEYERSPDINVLLHFEESCIKLHNNGYWF
jgi:hypothetical protein